MKQEERQQLALATTVQEEAAQRNLTAKEVQKERFASLLASGSSTEDAALAVEISAATGYRWAKEDGVTKLVKEWRAEVKEGLVRKMVRHGGVAIETVLDIMQDAEVSAQTRLQAAFGIMDRIGLSAQQLAQTGNEGAQVVIEQFLQLNVNAADEQAKRALAHAAPRVSIQAPAIDADFEEVDDEEATAA